jgi:3D (Asp-Asp-Asp) domain-containing protein
MGASIAFLALFITATETLANDGAYPVIGKFRNTYYYSVLESDYIGQPATDNILDMDDNIVATVPAKFRKAMDIEGTGRLNDGRVINYIGVKNKQIRYTVTIHPHGRGVGNCALIPFHTIAVDRSKIALGSVVYIDETAGMLLPDGTIHDGYWRAEDVGGAIKQDRMDLFIGDGDQGATLVRHGIKNLQALTVRLVSPPPADNCADLPPQ